MAEYNASGTLLNRYIHGAGSDDPLVHYSGTGTANKRYLLSDERGSIVSETDASGNEVETHRYGPYGEPINQSASRFRYTGQILIPGTELYHYKARVYHPKLGRFMQTDPIGYEDGMNWYAYGGNDPVNMTDPSGLCGRFKGNRGCGGYKIDGDVSDLTEGNAQKGPRVIDSTSEALDHYFDGNGEAVELGPNTKDALRNHPLVQRQSEALRTGSANHLNSNLSVEMRGDVYHVGKTRVDFSTTCQSGSCKTTYVGVSNDGFWDPIAPTGFGDGIGGSWELYGGTGYHYNTYTWSETYKDNF